MKSCNSSTKLERKTVERNRRMQMKILCFKLASIIPSHHQSKDGLSQQDKLVHAADYIKKMKGKIDELKRKRDLARSVQGIDRDESGRTLMGFKRPMVEICDSDSTLKVAFISGLNKKIKLSQVISLLEEEGAEVVSANLYFAADSVFHTIHSKVKSSRVGLDGARVKERLSQLFYETM